MTVEPETSHLRHAIRVAAVALTVFACGAIALAAAAVFFLHLAIQPVLSGSMRPSFSPGAAIVTRSIPSSSVQRGDVIVFTPPGETSRFAHRVTSVSGPKNRPIITTKGDANPAADPWHAQIVTPSVPKVVGSIPWFGRLLVAVEQRGPRLLLVVAAGLVICVLGTRSILDAPGPDLSPPVAAALPPSP